MGCKNCSSTQKQGCRNKGYCRSGGCSLHNTYNWLSDIAVPLQQEFDIVEVGFKAGRKDFFRKPPELNLITGDPVVVNVVGGHHIGYVSLQGELVRLQMSKRNVDVDESIRGIYRKARKNDLEKWEEVKQRESYTFQRTKKFIRDIGLGMKLNDVEFHADGTKAIFYYSAEERVDFRELIQLLNKEFRINIEMRQISVRHEAGRIGGLGVCGRELCCSTWMNSFKTVLSSAARYQNLAINTTKLSGQCGKLKCCLNFELDTYIDALKVMPEITKPLLTQQGQAKLEKTDIFRKILWFSYGNDNNWHAVTAKRVFEILEQNKKGKTPFDLQNDEASEELFVKGEINKDLMELDKKFNFKKKPKKKEFKKI